jgi:superfamily I DNA and RNA helicase
MTPKEKSIELVEQFSSVLMHDEVYEDSIKCALISVDQIFEALDEHHWQNRNVTEYYREVKHEIEKL